MTIDHREISEKLKGLWKKTGEDWTLSISVSLTEPTAPVAGIAPDGNNMTRYTCWGDSIEDAVNKAVDLVYREVILGEKIRPHAPFTNPDDRKKYPWIPDGGEG